MSEQCSAPVALSPLFMPSSCPLHALIMPWSCPLHALFMPSSCPLHVLFMPSSCPLHAFVCMCVVLVCIKCDKHEKFSPSIAPHSHLDFCVLCCLLIFYGLYRSSIHPLFILCSSSIYCLYRMQWAKGKCSTPSASLSRPFSSFLSLIAVNIEPIENK
jgi:hypothetical protein